MSFWDHVDELRKRLLRSLLFIAIAAIIGFLLSEKIQAFLVRPFLEFVKGGSLTLLAPADGFVVQIKIALLAGAVIAAPFVAFQMYGFVSPGLRPREKKWLFPVALLATILFWSGVVFAWLVMPAALEFLGSYGGGGIQNFWSLKSYISFVLFLLLAFGAIFQLPIVMGLLIATGVTSSHFFRRHRRYAVVAIVVISALATPTTDALTMSLMVAPLLVLYELSIWVGVWIEKNRKIKK